MAKNVQSHALPNVMEMTCGVLEDTILTVVKCQTLACQPKEVSMKKIFTRFS
jgi:hypothetical protein